MPRVRLLTCAIWSSAAMLVAIMLLVFGPSLWYTRYGSDVYGTLKTIATDKQVYAHGDPIRVTLTIASAGGTRQLFLPEATDEWLVITAFHAGSGLRTRCEGVNGRPDAVVVSRKVVVEPGVPWRMELEGHVTRDPSNGLFEIQINGLGVLRDLPAGEVFLGGYVLPDRVDPSFSDAPFGIDRGALIVLADDR